MDNLSLKILKMYNKRQNLSINQAGAIFDMSPFEISEHIIRLQGKGYLRLEPNYATLHGTQSNTPINVDAPLQITLDGIEAVETAQQLDRQRRNELIRYIITTAIAVAAFIKSFFF